MNNKTISHWENANSNYIENIPIILEDNSNASQPFAYNFLMLFLLFSY